MSGSGDAGSGAASDGHRYKPGDLIIRSDPLAHVLMPKCKADYCDHCHAQRPDLKRCAGCRLFYYCDKECQTIDWKSFHKLGECNWYKKLAAVTATPIQLLAASPVTALIMRTHFVLKSKPDLMIHKYEAHDGRAVSFADIPENTGQAAAGHDAAVRQLVQSLSAIDPENFVPSRCLSHFSSLFHKIRNSYFLTSANTAMAVYVPVSVMSHSCRPNAAFTFKKNQIRVKAMREIAPGEEVTIAVADVVMDPKSIRQRDIKVHRGFTCSCDRCKAGDQPDEVSELAFDAMLKVQLKELMTSADPVPTDEHLQQLLKAIPIKEKYIGPHHPHLTEFMLTAAEWIKMKAAKTQKDKQDFDDLVQKLRREIPITHGDEDETLVTIDRIDHLVRATDWSGVDV